MPLVSMKLKNLGPFTDIAFEFDPKVNVFVGPNNCGKTTALLALARTIGATLFFFPSKLVRGGNGTIELSDPFGTVRGYFKGLSAYDRAKEFHPSDGVGIIRGQYNEEALGYLSFVPAIRLCTDFRSKGPTVRKNVFRRLTETSSYSADESIIQKMVDLDYQSYREDNQGIKQAMKLIGELASRITEGFRLVFDGVKKDRQGLFLQFDTPDGVLPLNVLSQGTQSLVQWCARLVIGYGEHFSFPESLGGKPGVLIIDEIDAHLHPSWQRRIIPALTETFPSLQIFCATHSPLMLSGLKAGQVHLLKRDDKGKVLVSTNEKDLLGWSTDEIYSSFMGLPDATDLDTQQKLDRLRELRHKERLNAGENKELESLRHEVGHILRSGLGQERVVELVARVNAALRKAKRRNVKPVKRKAGRLRTGALNAHS